MNVEMLEYFQPTRESQELLDKTLTGIGDHFLDDPSAIYAYPALPLPTISPLCTDGTHLDDYMDWLNTHIVQKATRTSSGKMVGHMTTALPYFHRYLAKLLVTMNQNLVKIETASTLTQLERQTISLLHQTFYKFNRDFYDAYAMSPTHSIGVATSGGTVANITALWMARNSALAPKESIGCQGISVEGIVSAMSKYGYRDAVIIGSCLLHYSFKKAADLLGLGESGLRLIPVDASFRIRLDLLQQEIESCLASKILIIAVVGIAGTTEAGSIDSLEDIAYLASKYGIHYHIDAAWGGPLIFSSDHSYKLNGIQLADSITVDGHKQFYTPMGLGILLTKSPLLAHSIRKTASYVIRADSEDLGKYTLEGSRPGNILYLHASLHLLGKGGLGVLLTRSCTLVKQLCERLKTHPSGAFSVVTEPMTNLLLYRYVPSGLRFKSILTEGEDQELSDITQMIQRKQAESHDPKVAFVSRTRIWRDKWLDVFRVVIANPLTRWSDVEDMIVDQLSIGQYCEVLIARQQRNARLLSSQWPMKAT